MTRYALYEDPGIRGCGVAIFDLDEKLLLHAAYVPNPCKKGNRAEACRAVVLAIVDWSFGYGFKRLGVEWPQMYQPGKQRGDQNDLPPLAGVGAGLAVYYPDAEVVSYMPREWKGTLNADAFIEHIRDRLTEAERARITWRGGVDLKKNAVMHNVFDGIGLGLYDLGRLKPSRPYSFSEE